MLLENMDLYDLLKERELLKAFLKDLIEDAHFVDTCGLFPIRTLEQRITEIEKLIVEEAKYALSE
jgi:hypothetical protein